MNLLDLNEDILISILQFLDVKELENVCRVCDRLAELVDRYFFFRMTLDLLMTCHRKTDSLHCLRTQGDDIPFRRRWKLHENWRQGRYEEIMFFPHRVPYSSHIHLERDWLYMTHGGQVRVHRRRSKDFLKRFPDMSYGNTRDPDITAFTKAGSIIFAGTMCGTVLLYDPQHCSGMNFISQKIASVKEYLNSVDFRNDIFVTTTNQSAKLWRKEIELGFVLLESTCDLQEAFKCVKISPDGDHMAAGRYRDPCCALKLIDMATGVVQQLKSTSHAVYHVLWRDHTTLLTANFDSTFRVFDIRSNSDVQVYEDPYDSSVYCLDFDDHFGVLCGMKHHGRVNLYDLRVTRKFVQMFYPSQMNSYGSPVYDIVSDASQLFVVTDRNLRLFNFDADWAAYRDYSSVFNFDQ
ncbi:F-box/WD repeat-containing protein 4 [Phlebotomus argentipes]|uniref:F-box/WD repeat-containing protein 4 n=1 Tax=Phlebotomus argentipes TaxID=94469 RepID=UPI002892F507|nr:F-box/WD repeat-containing protein 4 [Phlebotomus argentipes]